MAVFQAEADLHKSRSLLYRYPMSSYFLLSFALAWTWWLFIGIVMPNPSTALILPGAWAPTLAALILTAHRDGRNGVRLLLSQLGRWRVGLRWYAFAILSPTLIALIAIGIDRLLGGPAPSLTSIAARFGLAADQVSLLGLLLPLIFLITIVGGGPIAEELGWRGYAQPRLQTQLGVGRAGLVIGVLWSLWHIPLFLVLPAATGNVPLAWYIPLVSAWGGLFGWLYSSTHGSVWLCILFHAGVNFVLGALGLLTLSPRKQPLTIFVILTCMVAVLVFQRM